VVKKPLTLNSAQDRALQKLAIKLSQKGELRVNVLPVALLLPEGISIALRVDLVNL
jgi:hypothetical protein